MRVRLPRFFDQFRSVTCSGCGVPIGSVSNVEYKVELGKASVYFCEGCHQRLVSIDDEFDIIRARLRANGVVHANQNPLAKHSQCPNCGQSAASDLMFGADLTKDLDRKDIVFSLAYFGVSFRFHDEYTVSSAVARDVAAPPADFQAKLRLPLIGDVAQIVSRAERGTDDPGVQAAWRERVEQERRELERVGAGLTSSLRASTVMQAGNSTTRVFTLRSPSVPISMRHLPRP